MCKVHDHHQLPFTILDSPFIIYHFIHHSQITIHHTSFTILFTIHHSLYLLFTIYNSDSPFFIHLSKLTINVWLSTNQNLKKLYTFHILYVYHTYNLSQSFLRLAIESFYLQTITVHHFIQQEKNCNLSFSSNILRKRKLRNIFVVFHFATNLILSYFSSISEFSVHAKFSTKIK